MPFGEAPSLVPAGVLADIGLMRASLSEPGRLTRGRVAPAGRPRGPRRAVLLHALEAQEALVLLFDADGHYDGAVPTDAPEAPPEEEQPE